jgi:hypothetical protein
MVFPAIYQRRSCAPHTPSLIIITNSYQARCYLSRQLADDRWVAPKVYVLASDLAPSPTNNCRVEVSTAATFSRISKKHPIRTNRTAGSGKLEMVLVCTKFRKRANQVVGAVMCEGNVVRAMSRVYPLQVWLFSESQTPFASHGSTRCCWLCR